MSVVTLVSGGLDSALLAVMVKGQRVTQYPLFLDYGQRASEREWVACRTVLRRHRVPTPTRLDISGYGRLIKSGLTTRQAKLKEEAFLPGRNLVFLLFAAAYAVQKRADAVGIGLLNDSTHLFPDQTADFVQTAEHAIAVAMGKRIAVLTPMMVFSKADVLELAAQRRITGTYSCHAGTKTPCGKCISCLEILSASRGGKNGR